MTCCHCVSMNEVFDRKGAEKARRRYGRKGPDKTTRVLLQAIGQTDRVKGRTVLDVGGGIGVIGRELTDEGAAAVTHVESSPGYSEVAREEAEARGHADRADFIVGDFVELAGELEEADVVVLHRVVCCYPEYEALLTQAARRAGDIVAFSFPRERLYTRAAVALLNRWLSFRGSDFRVYVHPVPAMRAVLRREGLAPRIETGTLVWGMDVWTRPTRSFGGR